MYGVGCVVQLEETSADSSGVAFGITDFEFVLISSTLSLNKPRKLQLGHITRL